MLRRLARKAITDHPSSVVCLSFRSFGYESDTIKAIAMTLKSKHPEKNLNGSLK